MRKKKYIEGQAYGSLTLVREIEPSGKNRRFLCQCSCGNLSERFTASLHPTTKCVKCMSGRHLLSHTAEHGIWQGMIDRCENENSSGYRNYGGRGISVCDRWRRSFTDFLQDMGKRPTPNHSIDRINNNGNYEPDNCRWATVEQQAKNRRNTVMVEYDGVSLCVADWARRLGISHQRVHQRLAKYPVHVALSSNRPRKRGGGRKLALRSGSG